MFIKPLTNYATMPPTWPIHTMDMDMGDPTACSIILFLTFTYAELPAFQQEASQAIQRQHHNWRLP